MGDFPKLLLDGLVECGMTMTVEIDPDRRRSIQVFPAFRIDHVGAFPSFDDEGFFLFPFLHLGKGMPEVFPVPVSQPIGAFSFGHPNVNPLKDRLRNPKRKLQIIRSWRGLYEGGDFFDNLRAG